MYSLESPKIAVSNGYLTYIDDSLKFEACASA